MEDFMCARICDNLQLELHKDVLRSIIDQDEFYRVLGNFSVEIMGIAPNYKRAENRQSFTIKIRYGVNMFSDYAGRVGFRDGLPGRLYKAKIDVTVLLDDGNKIRPNKEGRFVVDDRITDELQIKKIEVGPISLVAVFDGKEIDNTWIGT